jgi:hypothetical protein
MSIIKNDLAVATEPVRLSLMITGYTIAIPNSAKQSINIFYNSKKEQLREILLRILFPSFSYFLSYILKKSM